MKPHPHAKFIKAWADGFEIEYRTADPDWKPIFSGWSWDNQFVVGYRIKPEPKPDVVQFWCASCEPLKRPLDNNLKLTFDCETGQLKSAEVLK